MSHQPELTFYQRMKLSHPDMRQSWEIAEFADNYRTQIDAERETAQKISRQKGE